MSEPVKLPSEASYLARLAERGRPGGIYGPRKAPTAARPTSREPKALREDPFEALDGEEEWGPQSEPDAATSPPARAEAVRPAETRSERPGPESPAPSVPTDAAPVLDDTVSDAWREPASRAVRPRVDRPESSHESRSDPASALSEATDAARAADASADRATEAAGRAERWAEHAETIRRAATSDRLAAFVSPPEPLPARAPATAVRHDATPRASRPAEPPAVEPPDDRQQPADAAPPRPVLAPGLPLAGFSDISLAPAPTAPVPVPVAPQEPSAALAPTPRSEPAAAPPPARAPHVTIGHVRVEIVPPPAAARGAGPSARRRSGHRPAAAAPTADAPPRTLLRFGMGQL